MASAGHSRHAPPEARIWPRRVFLALVLALVLCACGGSDSGSGAARFAVLADPHVYDTALGLEGPAYEAAVAGDPKLIGLSASLLASALDEIADSGASFLLVCGDLTKDGEAAGHELAASLFSDLEAAGVEVYVVPGNHDIENPRACGYSRQGAVPVDGLDEDAFVSLYWRMGYDQALSRDEFSLSYTAEPMPGVLLLALDTRAGPGDVGGNLAPRTLSWAEDRVSEARELGLRVMAMGHHGFIEHFPGQSQWFDDYLLPGWEEVSRSLALAGLDLVFTGHSHANDAASRTWSVRGVNATLVDVETASTACYPVSWRLCRVEPDAVRISTLELAFADADLGGLSPTAYSRFMLEPLFRDLCQSMLSGFSLPLVDEPVSQEQAEAISAPMTRAALAHAFGDETPDDQDLAELRELSASANPVLRILAGYLEGVWRDTGPADRELEVPWPAMLPRPSSL